LDVVLPSQAPAGKSVQSLLLFDLGRVAFSYVLAAVGIWHLTAFSSSASFLSVRGNLRSACIDPDNSGIEKQKAVDLRKAISAGELMLGVSAAIWLRRRFSVRPGITCPSQIGG
jgi:hypothetical protein